MGPVREGKKFGASKDAAANGLSPGLPLFEAGIGFCKFVELFLCVLRALIVALAKGGVGPRGFSAAGLEQK